MTASWRSVKADSLEKAFSLAFKECESAGRNRAGKFAPAAIVGERELDLPRLCLHLHFDEYGRKQHTFGDGDGGVKLAVRVGQINLHPAVIAAGAGGDVAENSLRVEGTRFRGVLRRRDGNGQQTEGAT